MKKFSLLVFVAMLLIATSCSKEKSQQRKIVGEWEMVDFTTESTTKLAMEGIEIEGMSLTLDFIEGDISMEITNNPDEYITLGSFKALVETKIPGEDPVSTEMEATTTVGKGEWIIKEEKLYLTSDQESIAFDIIELTNSSLIIEIDNSTTTTTSVGTLTEESFSHVEYKKK